MIDLRSDTLTKPNRAMLECILSAELGDDGRQNEQGRGEDKTTNLLEDYAAKLVGKEEGLFFSSGTLANTCALLTWCVPNDKVAVDACSHVYRTERVAFSPSFGQLIPRFYDFTEEQLPAPDSICNFLNKEPISLICLENTLNARGGVAIPPILLSEISQIAGRHKVPIHIDGARLFNAAISLSVDAKELCQYADSVMFCISKGLGAPVGSLLCGSGAFIRQARKTRKLLGGNMRQCGVIAAPALYALQHNIDSLRKDNANATSFAYTLNSLKTGRVRPHTDSNIVLMDITPYGISVDEYCAELSESGVLASSLDGKYIRFVFYNGITTQDAHEAAKIVLELDHKLSAKI